MTVRWPIHVLRVQTPAFDLAARSLAGPSSVNGSTQTVSSDAGIWKATLGGVIIRDRRTVLCFRALAAILDGRVNPILVPLCRAYQPVPDDSVGLYDEVPHSDDATHDDGTGYQGSVTDVELALAVPARAVSASVTINVAGDLDAGQHFSIGDRLYRIRTIAFTSPTAANITFRPPLRNAAPAGQRLEFDDPVVRMKLATDGEMDLALESHRFATPTVKFIEDV